MVLCLVMASCSKDEPEVVEESNYTIDLNLAKETDWEMADAILQLINEHRSSNGLSRLQRDQQYASAHAVEHTQYMIEKSKISHDNFYQRSEALKDRGAKIVGENVAFGYTEAETVMHAWLSSDGHRKVIEGLYTHVGFGIVPNEDGNYYYTLLFYRK